MADNGKCQCTPYDHCRGRPKFKAKVCQCVKCKQKRLDEEAAKCAAEETAAKQGMAGALKGAACRGIDVPTGVDGLRGSVGVAYFGNESLNFFFTFLLEILGILVFFAIATLMFWVSVCYYAIKMVIVVKDANRNVKLATAAVIGLILLAFAVNLASNRTCPHKGKKSPAPLPSTAKKKSKCGTAECQAKQTKKTPTRLKGGKCKSATSASKTCPHKPKCQSKCQSKAQSKGPSCAAKKKPFAQMAKGQQKTNQRSYTDCEGRQIFQNSRRYAIPTEMKQPPTLIIYIRDWLSRLLSRGSQ